MDLGSRVRKLYAHEQYPGVRTQALHQEGVQSGSRCRQYQLGCDKLACINSVEAAHQKSSPQLHVCWNDYLLPVGRGNICSVWIFSEGFSDFQEKQATRNISQT
jgi:hypothetical protein